MDLHNTPLDTDERLVELIKSLSEAALTKVQTWIVGRLGGADPYCRPDARSAELPYLLPIRLFRNQNISDALRQRIWSAVLSLVEAIASQGENAPAYPVATDLLLLASGLANIPTISELEIESLRSHLFRIISHSSSRHNFELRDRALQSLVEIKTLASPEYWISHYDGANPENTSIVFEALAQYHPESAFRWLSTLHWSENVADAYVNLLPLLTERFGLKRLEGYLRNDLIENCDPESKEHFLALWVAEGFDVLLPPDARLPALDGEPSPKVSRSPEQVAARVIQLASEFKRKPESEQLELAEKLAEPFKSSDFPLPAHLLRSTIPEDAILKQKAWLPFPITSGIEASFYSDPAFWSLYGNVFVNSGKILLVNAARLLAAEPNYKFHPFLLELCRQIRVAGAKC